MSDGGKGSTPRPFYVSNEEYSKRWDMIFGRDLLKEEGSSELKELKNSNMLVETNEKPRDTL